ncbi:MAG: tRNA (adenosine(37)-N6)-threonylcarbamoyltransferase complex ATPase subunit type 1 TsaE [Epsilonproteobacteria bacterium]|nr:tRNA (adenosine(37)-N6)-threonylcarbamoyltransferase complex ATPase subunit type 1 TsaE [Campylobacterota bacterium]
MIEVESLDDLKKVIECIKKSGKNIIILSGTLGSGKTTLVKEFVKSLGLKNEVSSPTFALQNVYDARVYHYDLYNKNVDEFLALGMLEEFEKEGYHFLEWGEGLSEVLERYGFDYLTVRIDLKENKRIFKC